MSYFATEPEDIIAYARQIASTPNQNLTTICLAIGKPRSRGIFLSNPLNFSVPLLLLQMAVSSGVILIISRLLKPLGQPVMVSQILGGILLGPSVLGRSKKYLKSIFPLKSLITLDLVSSFGFIFYFFLIGIQLDPTVIKSLDKKTFFIGFSTVALPMVLSTGSALFLGHLTPGEEFTKVLPPIGQAESVLSFPMVAYFLSELRILNSEFGRVALSSSMVSTLCSLLITTTSILIHQSAGENLQIMKTLGFGILLTIIIFLIRPAVLWMIRKNPDGHPMKETYIFLVLIAVLLVAFCSAAMGLHLYFGPFVLGIILPAGPPMGSALMEKLELITSWMLMPLFFVKNGLVINVSAVGWKQYLIVQAVALVAAFGKFMGTFLISLRCRVPTRDAVSLGLIMNVQGVLELGLFKMLKKNKVIDYSSFVVLCIFMVIITGAVIPIIRHLFDPMRRYVVYKKRTMMHMRPNTELCLVVCIHDQDNVPIIINILETLTSKKQNPIAVYVLHLVELIGRATPLLIPHKPIGKPFSQAMASEPVVRAFRYFEQNSSRLVSMFPFTAISPIKTMHEDICSIAYEKGASLIIIPFHKRFQADGSIVSTKKAIRITNQNILNMSPCSVAILIDRGFMKRPMGPLEISSTYRVAVLFLGGADDREALALGVKMASHPCINLTIIRLVEGKDVINFDMDDKKIDNEVVSTFRTSMSENFRVTYIEEVVMDGSGTIAVIRSLENLYELIMVGRQHDELSPLTSGLTIWSEHKELGTVGDVLASADFMANSAILVLQQHRV